MAKPIYTGRKVLLIAPQPFFAQRGTPINVRALVQALVENGYSPTLLAFPLGEDIMIEGATIKRGFSIPYIKNVSIGFSLSKLLLDVGLFVSAVFLVFGESFVAIHGIEEGAFIAGILGMLRRIPFVFDLDSDMSEQLKSQKFPLSMLPENFFVSFEKFFLRRAKLAIPVCRALTDKVRQLAPDVPVVQIEDIPVAEALRLTPTLDPSELKAKFARHDEKLIVYTGNFEKYQGLDILFEGFQQFANRYTENRPAGQNTSALLPFKLVIIGGKESDVAAWQASTIYENLRESIVFLGEQPIQEIPAYEHCADMLVSPRKYGTNTPMKLYSYMLAGKPILATRIESHTQVLDDSSAFLFEPNAASFADLLTRLATESALLRETGGQRAAKAKQIVESQYSWQAFSHKVQTAYQLVVS